MAERRYTDEEIPKIFERATEAQQSTRRLPASGEGMTLADLQEIGRDVGIPPALVADAARSCPPANDEGQCARYDVRRSRPSWSRRRHLSDDRAQRYPGSATTQVGELAPTSDGRTRRSPNAERPAG